MADGFDLRRIKRSRIPYLRRKLARLKVRAEIRSVRGAGYMLEAIPC